MTRSLFFRVCKLLSPVCLFKTLTTPGSLAPERTAEDLLWAVWKNDAEVVHELLSVPGIDVNRSDRHGMTPLMVAAFRGNPVIFKMLLHAQGIKIAPVENERRRSGRL